MGVDPHLVSCSRAGCRARDVPEEQVPIICSGCRQVRYCCPQCQKLDWLLVHQHHCSTENRPFRTVKADEFAAAAAQQQQNANQTNSDNSNNNNNKQQPEPSETMRSLINNDKIRKYIESVLPPPPGKDGYDPSQHPEKRGLFAIITQIGGSQIRWFDEKDIDKDPLLASGDVGNLKNLVRTYDPHSQFVVLIIIRLPTSALSEVKAVTELAVFDRVSM